MITMVILGCIICLSLGASVGLLAAGLCAAASDKAQRLNAKWDADGQRVPGSLRVKKSPACFEQMKGMSDARYAAANRSDRNL
jgi:hypothetical protein